MYVLVWVRVTLINDQNIKSNKANSKITMYKRLYAKSICLQWLTREWTVGLKGKDTLRDLEKSLKV